MKKIYPMIAALVLAIYLAFMTLLTIDLRVYLLNLHFLFTLSPAVLLLFSAFRLKEIGTAFRVAFRGGEAKDIDLGIAFFSAFQKHLALAGLFGLVFIALGLVWKMNGYPFEVWNYTTTLGFFVLLDALMISSIVCVPFSSALKKIKT